MKQVSLVFVFALFFQTTFAQEKVEKDFKRHFDNYGVNGCFVLYNQSQDVLYCYNKERCDSGYIPASSFKIPNSLIALEEQVISDTSQIIEWDGVERSIQKWNQDQTLKTALKYSSVWVYEGFAEQIGVDTYTKYLEVFEYGNNDLSGPPTRFWLEGPFRVSANEQLSFLRKFYYYDLNVSKRSTDMVKAIMLRERGDNYVISGKTGTGKLTDGKIVMWLVGYVEKDDNPYFFALNITGNESDRTKFYIRNNILKEILKELAIL